MVKLDEKVILKDVSKRTFILPQTLMKMILIWPFQQRKIIKITFFIVISLVSMMEICQICYLLYHFKDVIKLALTLSTVSTTLQAIIKLLVLFLNQNKLKSIITEVYNNFWPSDLLGPKLEKSLASMSNLVTINMFSVLISGYLFGVGLYAKNLYDNELPFPFPLNLQNTYIYEVVFVLQILINSYFILLTILAHDFILLSLSSNVVSQYRLLKKIIKKIGKGGDIEWNIKLSYIKGVAYNNDFKEDKEEIIMMKRCIDHHNKLLTICSKMDNIFMLSLSVQLAASVTAICVSSFLITRVQLDFSQILHMISYCVGHVLQLFIMCVAGNELSYQSSTLGNDAYFCNWYIKSNTKVRRYLLMLMIRCKKHSRLSALNMNLNYNTFIAVMRLSFSFYTLLSKIVDKL